ncbi:phospholipase-like protein [Tanacetum coccineum]
MRTRSSSNLIGSSSSNPTTTNPKRRNRRRSKQRVEPFSLEESPVVTMADQRTMVELLRAPTEGYAEAIVVPPILAEHFEIKHSLINMMTSDQFFGLEKDNPHDHIRCTYPSRHFNSFCYDDDDDEEYTIAIIPKKPVDSLIMEDEHLDTISEMESDEFIKSSVENLVLTPSESEDFSDIESECDVPDCDDSQTTKFSTFSNPLFDDSTSSDDESSHEEVIYEMSFKTYSNPLFDLDKEIISSEFNLIHNEDLDSTPKDVRFDAESYLLESLVNHDTLMASPPKIDFLLDEFAGELTRLQSIPPGIDNINLDPEGDILFLESLLYDNSSPRPPEAFQANSDTIIDSSSTIPIPVEDSDSSREEIDIFFGPEDSIPPGIESDDFDSEDDDNSTSLPEFESFLKQIQSTPPPCFRKADDEICVTCVGATSILSVFAPDATLSWNNLDKIKEYVVMHPRKLPEKLGDPGKFLIPCGFSELKCKALADLDLNTGQMQESVFDPLWKSFTFPADFVIVDYESDPRVPLILGRPFLRTARALIDFHGEEMILHDGNERLTLNMRHDTSSYSTQPHQESINMIDVYNVSHEEILKDLFATNHLSGNPTFFTYFQTDLTSPEVNDDIFDLEGDIIENLLNLNKTKDLPPYHDNPFSGNPTLILKPVTKSSSSPTLTSIEESDLIWEEFKAYLASDSFPPGNSNPSSLLPPFHNSLSAVTTYSST